MSTEQLDKQQHTGTGKRTQGPEKKYEMHLRRYLDKRGWGVKAFSGVIRSDIGAPIKTGKSGTPDLLYCIGGIFFAIEVKSETGRPSDAQIAQMARVELAGGIAIIARPQVDADVRRLVEDDHIRYLTPCDRLAYVHGQYPALYTWRARIPDALLPAAGIPDDLLDDTDGILSGAMMPAT
ncbi:MAG: VRR-NUC domain-containing protein [Firmicutes bacterium]|nr:VRR-NUC domain-containing protein [Bacillota bacterium]